MTHRAVGGVAGTQVAVNEELDPALLVARLQQENSDLRAQLKWARLPLSLSLLPAANHCTCCGAGQALSASAVPKPSGCQLLGRAADELDGG